MHKLTFVLINEYFNLAFTFFWFKRACTQSFIQIRTVVNTVPSTVMTSFGQLISNTETYCGGKFSPQSSSRISGRVTCKFSLSITLNCCLDISDNRKSILFLLNERLFLGGFMILDMNVWLGFKFLIFLVLNFWSFNINVKCKQLCMNAFKWALVW